MIRRILKIAGIGLASTLLVFSLAVFWLLRSASGATWLWHQVEDSMPGTVRASRFEGDLASGFSVHGFQYLSESVEVSVDHLELIAGPGWWPLSIQVQTLALQDVDIVTRSPQASTKTADPETDVQSILAAMNLPVPVEIHNALLINVRHGLDDSAPVILFKSLRFRAVLDEQLTLEHLHLLTEGFEANAQARLELEHPFELNATANGRLSIDTGPDIAVQETPFELKISGNIDKLQFNLVGLDGALSLDGELQHPVGDLRWDLRAELDKFQWPINHPKDLLTLSGLTLDSKGHIDGWSLDLKSAIEYDVLQTSQLTLIGTGSATDMQIDTARLTGPGLDLRVNGKVDWLTQAEAGLRAVFKQLDLSPWLEDWPAGEYIAGDVQLNLSESGLQIPPGHLTVVGTDIAINVQADIDLAANSVDSQLSWKGFKWPLTGATPDFTSSEGDIRVSGTLDQWQTVGRLKVQMADYPQGYFNIEGDGDRGSARMTIVGGEVLGGSIEGEVYASWTNGLNWGADIRTTGVDPAPLFPDWPGSINAEASVASRSQPQSMQIQLKSLQAMLRGVPINAAGGLSIVEGNMVFNDLEVRTDEAELQIDGGPRGPDGVKLIFSGVLPSKLLDGANGHIELAGRYWGDTAQPLIEVQLEAHELAWRDLSIKNMTLSTPETALAGSLPALQMDATQLAWQENVFDRFSLSLIPAGDKHVLNVNLTNESLVLSTGLTLKPGRTENIFGAPWSGMLEKLALKVNQSYEFNLLKPAPLEWSADSAKLGPACVYESGGAQLCINSQFNRGNDWLIRVDAGRIPVNYLQDILELDIQFEQVVDGYLEWHQPHGRAPNGGAEFSISAGRVLDLVNNETLVESNEGRLEFVLQNGNLESGILDIEFPGNGFIDLDFEVQNIIEYGARKLTGQALVQLQNINLIGQLLFPGVGELGGSFESGIQLGGILSDPTFNGGFKLSDGLVRYSPVGLELDDIEIAGRLEKRDRGTLEGSFRAGEGVGSVTGNLLFKDLGHMQMQLALTGDKLLLINTDPLKIHAETDLKIELAPQRLDINGHIRVPAARLTPANLLLETVTDSEDLVVETGPVKARSVDEGIAPKIRVFGDLEVAFGDDVIIKAPGVKTSLGGSVMYHWSGDPVPLAEGQYILKGTVDVYGPTLQIDNGHISFPKVPANNPLLNIRAGREIFGNTQIRTAGVQVTGTLKRPVLTAYTIPLTNEDRAWTLLVTGTDFDQAQGVGGFDVGTYILPKLYVSYGISLFDDENVISARYDLKRGFGIKITSGQRETGVDVSYTIDR